MNSKEIFELALGLGTPWYISSVEFSSDESDKSNRTLRITIDYHSGYFVDEAKKSTVHDRVDRSWRHLNFGSMLKTVDDVYTSVVIIVTFDVIAYVGKARLASFFC